MNETIRKAKDLAAAKHAHLHLYNAARSPAITHIAEVAQMVEAYGGSEGMIAAAWLHDIVEDTDVTIADIERDFGGLITELVDGLTDPPEFAAMALPGRKSAQAERLKGKNAQIKTIKICDQISNVLRVTNDPPTDWDADQNVFYIRGAKRIVDVCKGTCPELEKRFEDAYIKACDKYGIEEQE